MFPGPAGAGKKRSLGKRRAQKSAGTSGGRGNKLWVLREVFLNGDEVVLRRLGNLRRIY